MINVLLECLEDRDVISFIELESRLEHAIKEIQLKEKGHVNIIVDHMTPSYPGICVEQSLVIVISNSSSVLYFPNHILHCTP